VPTLGRTQAIEGKYGEAKAELDKLAAEMEGL
jgi:hypothetical protein